MTTNQLFKRKASLIVLAGNDGLDLSELRFRFTIRAADTQSPNNAEIRIYNLSPDTARRIRGEYSRVVVQAGYDALHGVLFDGTIKWFRIGRENATDTYFDILAADGDIPYNFAVVQQSFAAGSSAKDHLEIAAKAMNLPLNLSPDFTGSNPQTLPRGKVAFGMARDIARRASDSIGATWSIQGGTIQVIPLTGYLPGEAIVLNQATGMIGLPEQTDEGIHVRTLINPKLRIGGLIRLDTKSINQLIAKDGNPWGGVPFNQWTGWQYVSKISDAADGLYRLYVVEHQGDTRGQEWYSDLVALSVNPSSGTVNAFG